MKLALYSDLHLEMVTHLKGTLVWEPPVLDVEIVILAGDIGSHARGIEWAAKAFQRWPTSPDIIYVAGNHEYSDHLQCVRNNHHDGRCNSLLFGQS